MAIYCYVASLFQRSILQILSSAINIVSVTMSQKNPVTFNLYHLKCGKISVPVAVSSYKVTWESGGIG